MSLQPLDGPAVYGNLSVSTTAVELKVGASVLEERKVATILPTDGTIYFGYDNTVTINTGTPIYKQQFFPFEVSEQLSIWVITETGTVNCRITEVA